MAIRLRTVAVRAWLAAIKTLLALLVLLVLVLAYVLGTEGGRLLLVSQAQTWVPRLTDQHLAIEGAFSPSLGQWRFARLEWQQGETGPAVALEDVTLDFKPSYLVSQRLWVEVFDARYVHVHLPEASEAQPGEAEPADESAELPSLEDIQALWQRIPGLQIDQLTVGELRLAQPGLAELTTSIDARLEINWGSWPIRLNLNLADGPDSQLAATVAVDAADALRLTGELNAPGESAWAQWMQWPLAEPIAGRWDLWLRANNGWATLDIDQLEVPWRAHTVRSDGQIAWRFDDSRLRFSEWRLFIDEHPTRLDGYVQAEQADLHIGIERLPWSLAESWVDLGDFSGELTADGRLTGGWQQPAFSGEVGFQGQYLGDPLIADLTTSGNADEMLIEMLTLRWADAEARAQGPLSWRDQQLDLTLAWSGLTQDRWQPWVAEWPDELTLTVEGEGQVQGALQEPDLSANLIASGQYDQEPLRLEAEVRGNQREIELSSLSLQTDKGQVRGQVQANLPAERFSLALELINLDSAWLPLLGIELPVQHDALLNAQLTGGGPFTDPVFEGAVQLAGQWQGQAAELEASIARLTTAELELSQLELSLAEARVQSRGTVNWERQELDLTGELEDLRVRMVRPLVPEMPPWLDDLAGGVDAEFKVVGSWLEPRITTDLNFAGRWLEQPLTASLSIGNETASRWQIPEARVQWSQLQLGYSGTVWPFDLRLEGQFDLQRLRMDDVARLPFDLPEELEDFEGELNLTGAIVGDALNPDITAQLDFQGQWQAQPLDLLVEVDQLNTEGVNITRAQLRSGSSALTLDGGVNWQPLDVNLNARMENWQIEQWLPLVPGIDDLPLSSLTGRIDGALSMTGGWPSANLDGQLEGNGDYLGDAWSLTWAGQGRLDDALNHSLSLEWGDADLAVELVNQGDELEGHLSLNRVTLAQLAVLGADLGPEFEGSLSGTLAVAGQITDPRVELNVDGSGRWIPVQTRFNGGTDWQLNIAAGGRLQDWQITTALADLGPAGTLNISGHGSDERLVLEAEIDIPQLRYWLPDQSEWHGQLSSRVAVAGTTDAPEVDVRLNWQSSNWPLQLQVELVTEEGEHRLSSNLIDDGQPRLNLEISTAQTPLTAWQEDLFERPFAADLQLDTDSTVLAPLLRDLPDQDFSGEMQGRLSVAGTLRDPEWTGRAELRNGRYENAALGTILSNMSATLTANRRELDLALNARDGGNGRIRLGGQLLWQQEREEWWLPELDLALDLNSARILRRVDVEATADGGLTVTGPWRDMLVAGTIDVIPLTIRLNNVLQSAGSGLNVVRLDSANGDANGNGDELNLDNPYLPGGQWQVRLRADRRAQIFGQGLVAELSGELDITDELLEPAIGGRFEIVRGTYTAFGRIFNLSRGTIQIQGNQVLLDVYGIYEGQDIRVELNISGTQERLNLTLTSTPPLANDELMARLLFGRSVQEMSAFEAIILANELNRLRNPGAGGDILGDTRDRLGLDALIIDTETNEEGDTGINVAAGKYLSDRIYVEVETGVGTEQSFSSSLQLIITPNVNLELYTRGQFNSGGLELNWKNDY
ncbi:MAG: translocation/assembly module TamB domain-containing protein [Saccharospirillum sp.]|nr:translocation/assembly module TamB domain-containing protein [Saccharospirillum sp.]